MGCPASAERAALTTSRFQDVAPFSDRTVTNFWLAVVYFSRGTLPTKKGSERALLGDRVTFGGLNGNYR